MRCPVCDEKLPPQPQGRGRRRIYCSDRCRQLASRRSRLERSAVDLQPYGTVVDLDGLIPEMTNPSEDLAQTLGTIMYTKGALLKIAPKIEARLAWRCQKMAAHIQAGLDAYFK
jgi:predicted nucleic acid-binding Zn ribbon protein